MSIEVARSLERTLLKLDLARFWSWGCMRLHLAQIMAVERRWDCMPLANYVFDQPVVLPNGKRPEMRIAEYARSAEHALGIHLSSSRFKLRRSSSRPPPYDVLGVCRRVIRHTIKRAKEDGSNGHPIHKSKLADRCMLVIASQTIKTRFQFLLSVSHKTTRHINGPLCYIPCEESAKTHDNLQFIFCLCMFHSLKQYRITIALATRL